MLRIQLILSLKIMEGHIIAIFGLCSQNLIISSIFLSELFHVPDKANFQHENYGRPYMCNISAVQPKSDNFKHIFCRNLFFAADIPHFQLENHGRPYMCNISAVQPKSHNFTRIFCRNFFMLGYSWFSAWKLWMLIL